MDSGAGIAAVAGGVLIGLAAVLLMLTIGRIAGVAGIVGGLLDGLLDRSREGAADGERGWRVAFVAGSIIGPLLLAPLGLPSPVVHVDAPIGIVAVAGVLVGFGSRLGSGCTSGHGVCGLARLSRRSVAATLVFMSAGLLVVFLLHHAIGG